MRKITIRAVCFCLTVVLCVGLLAGAGISISKWFQGIYIGAVAGTSGVTVNLVDAEADGTPGTTSTKINLTFDEEVEGLTAGDIKIESMGGDVNVLDASPGSPGNTWSIDITVIQEGDVEVSVKNFGDYKFKGSIPVTVYKKAGDGPPPSETVPVNLEKATAVGTPGTTHIEFKFDEDVEGLTDGKIEIKSDSGAATVVKDSLTGEDKEWSIKINVTQTGDVKFSVKNFTFDNVEYEFTGNPKSVMVYKAEDEDKEPNGDPDPKEPDESGEHDRPINPPFYPGNPSSSSSSGGGGGGSSGGGAFSSQTGPSGGARSGNVSAGGSVNTTAVVNEARAAAGSGRANVTVKNATSISPDTLRRLASLSRSTGTPVTVRADTTLPGGGIEARLYINPADFAGRETDLNLTVRTTGARVEALKAQLQGQFGRNAAVIRFDQTGSFGATIKVAVRVDLGNLDTDNLKFYSVSSDGTVREIQTTYRIDSNGFLHFSTPRGGTIVVTNRNV
ncbi:MAG: hypothetical protein FWG94_06935 [Oscillospiraceae bacterium]|nr:hypothetical protein [Oscillospiraceae bacterium]